MKGKVEAGKYRVLFCVFADEENHNAQSLNAREVALRLDPERFTVALFSLGTPDARLLEKENVEIIPVAWRRLGSVYMAWRMARGGFDLIFYGMLVERAFTLWRSLRFFFPGGRKTLRGESIEGSAAQMEDIPAEKKSRILKYLATADLCFGITPAIARDMGRKLGRPLPVIPVGYDQNLFRPQDRSGHGTPLRVVFLGSLQPRKRPHELLELAEYFESKSPGSVVFELIGAPLVRDDYYVNLLERASELPNVELRGPLSQAGIAGRFARADVFVLPSFKEGLPKVTLEAAATGLPCVIYRDYETPSVVDGVTGFQVASSQEFRDRLELLLSDAGRRLEMGRAGAEHVRQFGWDRVVPLWERAFLEVLGGGD